MAQYSALRCVSGIWQNSEKPLISNGLRFIFTCLLTGALWVLFHCSRHTFITQRLREGWTKDEVKIVSGHDSDDMIDRVYAHLTKEDKKRQLTKRINKVEETGKCSGTVNVGLGCSNSQTLIDEVKRQAVDIYEKEQAIQEQSERCRQLSDVNAVVQQHDEYITARFQELIEYGSLSGFDDNEVDDDLDVDLSDRGLK